MTTYHPRSTWTSTPRPTSKLVLLDAARLHGVAVHYPGDPGRLGTAPTLAESCRRLEGERRFHTDPPPAGRGWTDIAYQAAIDQAGRVFDCRGINYRSAANGDTTTNGTHGACTLLIGVGDTPTDAMIRAFQDWRTTVWLVRWPRATAVVGHRDLYQTACPGDAAYALVRNGTLAANPSGDDMPITTADAKLIANVLLEDPRLAGMLRTLPWAGGWPVGDKTEDAGTRLARASYTTRDLLAVLPDRIMEVIIATGGGTGLSLEEIKHAVREVLVEGTGGTP